MIKEKSHLCQPGLYPRPSFMLLITIILLVLTPLIQTRTGGVMPTTRMSTLPYFMTGTFFVYRRSSHIASLIVWGGQLHELGMVVYVGCALLKAYV